MVNKLKALAVIALSLPLISAWPNSGQKYPIVAYIGPGDAVSGAIFWFSCSRGYNAAYATGSNAGCNIVRASDSHTCDVLIAANGGMGNTSNCSTGGDSGQSASSFCNATTCAVTKAYDQSGASACSGACNASQATAANQPSLIFSCVGSSACMRNSSATASLVSSATLASNVNQPISASDVVFRTTTANTTVIATTANSTAEFYFSSSNTSIYAGTTFSVAYTAGTIVARNDVLNGASSVQNVNGSETTGPGGANGLLSTGKPELFIDVFNQQGATISIAEAGIWNSGFSSGNRTSLCRNQQAFYGAVNFGATC